MTTMKWNWSLILTVLLSSSGYSAQCDFSEQAHQLYDLEKSIVTKTLENGLIVRFVNRKDKKTVSVVSQFEVGSKNELNGQTGYAHLFEHLMFEGSKNAHADSFSQQMDSIGANTNATTWFDRTNYLKPFPLMHLNLPYFLIQIDLCFQT